MTPERQLRALGDYGAYLRHLPLSAYPVEETGIELNAAETTLDDPYRVRLRNRRGGFFTRDDKWDVENVGMAPDIDVENWPHEVIAGYDPQLERAVSEAMQLGVKNKLVRATRGPRWPKYAQTVMMSRYARYLVIQNADSAKDIVALGQHS